MQINPYLSFNGDCEAAFTFYQQVLGGEIVAMSRLGDSPMAANSPPETHNSIIHARLVIGSNVLMGSDGMGRYETPRGFSVTLNPTEPAEAERIFAALSEGAQVHLPLQPMFWALRFGMLVDRHGIPWMINCEAPVASA